MTEHSHGLSGRLVPGCAACDMEREARNRAIARLKDALFTLALLNQDDKRTSRINLGPVGVCGADVEHCHSIDLTTRQVDALADAVDSMNAYAGSRPTTDDQAVINRMLAAADARVASWAGEEIPSGEWSAAAVAQNDSELFAQVTGVFADMDLQQVREGALHEPRTDPAAVARAVDDVCGTTTDPSADSDEGQD
ncbi:hypothetical protein [Streptomyces sasae]|uniref:hypothetical protein n=1 Tax=Streptomyces sasae TaxID=1266772 RepID=UPI00292FA484|nr:hypothetical protein [Streptomyces sasae]